MNLAFPRIIQSVSYLFMFQKPVQKEITCSSRQDLRSSGAKHLTSSLVWPGMMELSESNDNTSLWPIMCGLSKKKWIVVKIQSLLFPVFYPSRNKIKVAGLVKTWIRTVSWITNPDFKRFVSYRGSWIMALKDLFQIVSHESSQFSKIRPFLRIKQILTNP